MDFHLNCVFYVTSEWFLCVCVCECVPVLSKGADVMLADGDIEWLFFVYMQAALDITALHVTCCVLTEAFHSTAVIFLLFLWRDSNRFWCRFPALVKWGRNPADSAVVIAERLNRNSGGLFLTSWCFFSISVAPSLFDLGVKTANDFKTLQEIKRDSIRTESLCGFVDLQNVNKQPWNRKDADYLLYYISCIAVNSHPLTCRANTKPHI